MTGMEKISGAILDKVRAEAQDIIREAETRAKERVERARKQRIARLEEEKGKRLEQAREEASRILAQASITARQELLLARTRIIDEIIGTVKKTLSGISNNGDSLLRLIEEAVNALDIDEVRIYVSPKDIKPLSEPLKGDKKLADRIKEIKEFDCSGGVIVEDIKGKIRIDNTYDTRLEMLLPNLLPELGRELFESL
jgi:vacuolar-type H+-ATPase subunit E/Vma4